MKFLSAEHYQATCDERFSYYQAKVRQLLSNVRVEHIGSSSIPGAISKGDLDIFIGVDAAELENAVRTLATLGFQEKQHTLRTPVLCMLESLTEEVAFQVVANDSEFESFLTFRDKLRSDADLVREYNALKMSCASLSHDAYRERKSVFVERVIAQA
ncbi:GrpB family protein [Vibrio sp. PP-XX7]